MAKKKHGWVREGGRWVRYVNGKRTRSQLPGPIDELGRRLRRLPRDMKTVASNAAKDIQTQGRSFKRSLTYKDNQTSGSPKTKQVTNTKPKATGNKVTGQADYTKQQQRLSDARSKYNKKSTPKAKPVPKAKPAAKAKPVPKAKSRVEGASSADRMAVWAKANSKMIKKSGTKKQKEILANALKKKDEKTKSAANKAGWPGNKNF